MQCFVLWYHYGYHVREFGSPGSAASFAGELNACFQEAHAEVIQPWKNEGKS